MAPTINLVGAGHVGRALGRIFAQSGAANVQDVLTRSKLSAEDAVDFIGAGRAVAHVQELRAADITLLAVGDDQIESACKVLAQHHNLDGTVVFHCSGAKSSASLIAAVGAWRASVHPIRSFAAPAGVAAHFAGTNCGIEGDEQALAVLRPLFEGVGARLVPIDAAHKTVYHAASVFASNYLVTMMDAALRAYEAAGIAPAVARELAAPLAQGTLDNVLRIGAPAALSGPIARGDFVTVAAQQAALDHWDAPTGALYEALVEATIRLAERQKQERAA